MRHLWNGYQRGDFNPAILRTTSPRRGATGRLWASDCVYTPALASSQAIIATVQYDDCLLPQPHGCHPIRKNNRRLSTKIIRPDSPRGVCGLLRVGAKGVTD